MVLRSFRDRVEVFVVSVPLSPSLGHIQPLSGINLVTRCSQQVILVLLIYYREDRATLVPIHIGSLSAGAQPLTPLGPDFPRRGKHISGKPNNPSDGKFRTHGDWSNPNNN